MGLEKAMISAHHAGLVCLARSNICFLLTLNSACGSSTCGMMAIEMDTNRDRYGSKE